MTFGGAGGPFWRYSQRRAEKMSAGATHLLLENRAMTSSLLFVSLVLLLGVDDKPRGDDEARAVEAVKKFGGAVSRDEKAPGKPIVGVDFAGTELTDKWLKEVAGALAALKDLKWLDLYQTEVTDAGLKELAGLKGLQKLRLSATGVTDAGLKHLKELKELRELNLAATKVSDKGVKELAGLKTLRWLSLLGSDVTDKGFEELKRALPECKVLGN